MFGETMWELDLKFMHMQMRLNQRWAMLKCDYNTNILIREETVNISLTIITLLSVNLYILYEPT